MKSKVQWRRPRALFLGSLLLLLAVCVSTSAEAAGRRDVIWDIVSNCLDPGVGGYCQKCSWPRVDSICGDKLSCRDTIEVWSLNDSFVALRDRKMCGCPSNFVHGLAVPRARVTGVEDPARPDGIWSFAWGIALQRIGDEQAAALAVNPEGARSQNQLHVHIMRLQPDARQRLGQIPTARIRGLDDVWKAASVMAAAAGLEDYGVLVARHPEGGFLVAVDPHSPEKQYGIEHCQ